MLNGILIANLFSGSTCPHPDSDWLNLGPTRAPQLRLTCDWFLKLIVIFVSYLQIFFTLQWVVSQFINQPFPHGSKVMLLRETLKFCTVRTQSCAGSHPRPGRAGQGRAGQGRPGQGRAGQGTANYWWMIWSVAIVSLNKLAHADTCGCSTHSLPHTQKWNRPVAVGWCTT